MGLLILRSAIKMKKLNDNELEKILGGDSTTISSSVINAVVNVIKLLEESGVKFGSAIRRIGEGNLCPLD